MATLYQFAAPLPTNEEARLDALRRYKILDSMAEQSFDDLALLTSEILQVPIALVTIIDRDRQWFKARLGTEMVETPREHAFCAHAILQPETLVVNDALLDNRFALNPLVTDGPKIRFYIGSRITTPDGYALGTVCGIDSSPRRISRDAVRAVEALSRQAGALLELRRMSLLLSEKNADLIRDGNASRRR